MVFILRTPSLYLSMDGHVVKTSFSINILCIMPIDVYFDDDTGKISFGVCILYVTSTYAYLDGDAVGFCSSSQ